MSQRGTYQTRQQEAVCALFAARPQECLTAEEAYQALKLTGEDVGKTTVYRAISRLCQAGRLRRYAPHESGEAARTTQRWGERRGQPARTARAAGESKRERPARAAGASRRRAARYSRCPRRPGRIR